MPEQLNGIGNRWALTRGIRVPGLLTAGGILSALIGGPALAQKTTISALWRERAVVEAQWTTEKAVYEQDREFHKALRARRSQPPEAPTPAPAAPEGGR